MFAYNLHISIQTGSSIPSVFSYSLFFKEMEYLIIFAMKRTNNSKNGVETIKSFFLENTFTRFPVYQSFMRFWIPVVSMVKITATICMPSQLLYLLFNTLFYSAAQKRKCYLQSTYGQTGLEGQHNLPKLTPIGHGRGKI